MKKIILTLCLFAGIVNGQIVGGYLTGTTGWKTSGNSVASDSSNFIGTTNAKPFVLKTNGTERMRVYGSNNSAITFSNIGTSSTNFSIRGLVGSPTLGAIYMGLSPNTESGSNYTILSDGFYNVFNGIGAGILKSNNNTIAYFTHDPVSALTGGVFVLNGITTPTYGLVNTPTFLKGGSTVTYTVGTLSRYDDSKLIGSTLLGKGNATVTDVTSLRVVPCAISTSFTASRNWAFISEGMSNITTSLIVGTSGVQPQAKFECQGTASITGNTSLLSSNVFGTSSSSNTHDFYLGTASTASMSFRAYAGNTAYPAIYFGQTPGSTNYFAYQNSTSTFVNAGADLYLNTNNTNRISINSTSAIFAMPLILKSYTVATLPTPTVGMMCYVSDALAPTYNAVIVGGGAVKTLVFYDGTNWTAH